MIMSELNNTPEMNEEAVLAEAAKEIASTADFVTEDTATNATPVDIDDDDEDAPDEDPASSTEQENPETEESENDSEASPRPVLTGHYIDSGNDMIQAQSPDFVQKQDEDEIRRAIRQHRVLYARVIGIEPMGDSIKIVARRNTMRIIFIPEDFFQYSLMKDMDGLSETEKVRRYTRKANRMLGAVISFVPREVGYFDDTDNHGRTVRIPFAVGSRADALRQLQNRFFFRPPDQTRVTVGSSTTASVLSTGPRYVIVEAFGIETSMGTGALSAYEFIEDASKRFPVGSGIPVAVERLAVDTENRTVSIHVSHALLERMEAKVETVNDSMIGARYLATIVNVTDRFYHAILNGMKIRGAIPRNANISNEMLSVGDQVSLLVRYINKEQGLVIGGCHKI